MLMKGLGRMERVKIDEKGWGEWRDVVLMKGLELMSGELMKEYSEDWVRGVCIENKRDEIGEEFKWMNKRVNVNDEDGWRERIWVGRVGIDKMGWGWK